MLDYKNIRSRYLKLSKQIKDFLLTKQCREFFIFLIFFGIAGAYWLLQTLNNDFETNVTFAVRLKNMPDNAVVTTGPPTEVHVLIKDKGTVLLNYFLGKRFYPITIDYDDYRDAEDCLLRICGDDLRREIQSQLNASTLLLTVTPDTLDVYYSKGKAKRVPVRLQGTVSAASQYYLSDTIFSPDSVWVYAPSEVLDTLKFVCTLPLSDTHIADTLVRRLPLMSRRAMKCVPDEVEVTLPVDIFTEKTVEVPLEGIGFPPGKVLRTFPSKVKVSFQTGLRHFRQVDAGDFHLYVTYEELLRLGNEKYTVKIGDLPGGVSNVRVEPAQVDFLIEQLN